MSTGDGEAGGLTWVVSVCVSCGLGWAEQPRSVCEREEGSGAAHQAQSARSGGWLDECWGDYRNQPVFFLKLETSNVSLQSQ